jgi:hypothetical protein
MDVLLYATDQCRLFLNRDVHCLVVDWKSYATTEQFRALHERLLKDIRCHKTTTLLGNAAGLMMIAAVDQKWLIDDFLPRLYETGVRAHAVVRSKHYFSQVAIDSLHLHDADTVAFQYFDHVDDARAWLKGFGSDRPT